MTQYSLRTRMMILIFVPMLFIGSLLSVFFIIHRYHVLQRHLETIGSNIIETLTVFSEYRVGPEHLRKMHDLLRIVHRNQANIVRAISIYDSDNHLIATSHFYADNESLRIASNNEIPQKLTVNINGDNMLLRMPVILNQMPQMDSAQIRRQIKNDAGYVVIQLDIRPIRLQQYQEIVIIILLLCGILALVMVRVYRLIHEVTGPLPGMVSTIDRIRQGDLSGRVSGIMPGELETLKNGINAMAASLADYREEMQNSIDQATRDLRETLAQMEIQNMGLDLAKKHAQEAARIKSEFLTNMSHELRTPLNGVIGFTRLMLKTELNDTQRDHLLTIGRSANHLLTIINNVLDFSKLEAQKLTLEHIPFSLRWMLDDVVTLLAHTAHDKGLELTLNIKNDVPDDVIGDPLRLQQSITNLVGNAIKFTETGNIDIVVSKRPIAANQMQLDVEIRDTGIGIARSDQARLFKAFCQADASISRNHGGSGLGLAITQGLIHEMGGSVSFHSEAGHGSIFFFNIPLDLASDGTDKHSAKDCLQGKRLAFIEANPMAAESTLELLADTPLTVTYRPDIDALPNVHFDIILLSVPVMLREPLSIQHQVLAKAAKLSQCIFLALPCHAQLNAEQLKHQGIAACLQKPITAIRLMPLLLEYCCDLVIPCNTALSLKEKLPMTVMAVDDNPANLKLVGVLLADLVQQVVLCKNGIQAQQQARNRDLDLILMDLRMPEINGVRTYEIIRKIPRHRHTPVIAVTAYIVASQTQQLLSIGISDHMEKPISEEKLWAVLLRYQRKKISQITPVEQDELPSAERVVDWQLALHQASGKVTLAKDLLRMLLEYLPVVRNIVSQHLAGNYQGNLIETIHKLHGSCSYTGVPRLKNLCQSIERQQRRGMALNDLEPEFWELLDEINNVETAIAKLSDNIS